MEHKKIMYLLAGVLLVAGGWFYFAGRNDVFNFGERTNRVREQSHSQERQKVLTEQATLLDQQREELKKLKEEISSSKAANEETKKSLENANAYLTKLEKEEKHKIRVKERQRNLWIGVSSGLLYAWIRK